jgi:hypothetical protein
MTAKYVAKSADWHDVGGINYVALPTNYSHCSKEYASYYTSTRPEMSHASASQSHRHSLATTQNRLSHAWAEDRGKVPLNSTYHPTASAFQDHTSGLVYQNPLHTSYAWSDGEVYSMLGSGTLLEIPCTSSFAMPEQSSSSAETASPASMKILSNTEVGSQVFVASSSTISPHVLLSRIRVLTITIASQRAESKSTAGVSGAERE